MCWANLNWYSAQSLFLVHRTILHPQILDLLDLLQRIRSHREAEPEEMLWHCGGFTRPGTWHLWRGEETHQRGAVFARVPWRYSCREQKNPPVPLLTWKLLSLWRLFSVFEWWLVNWQVDRLYGLHRESWSIKRCVACSTWSRQNGSNSNFQYGWLW